MELFSYKNVSEIASKFFGITVFFHWSLECKIVNETTRRMYLANSGQLYAH